MYICNNYIYRINQLKESLLKTQLNIIDMTKINKKSELAKLDKEKLELINRINFDADMISLTDLWREAGSDPQKTPAKWQESEPVQRFIRSASRILNIGNSDIIKSKRGKGGGTYGHKQIAIEYAQYLDEHLAILVNEVFFQRVEEEKNPDLIVDRAIKTYKRKGYSPEWISKRIDGKTKRNEFTSCLAEHGCDKDGIRNSTNGIYTPFFGGSSNVVRLKKGLTKKESIRDNMTEVELESIKFAETLAKDSISRNDLRGNAKCEIASINAARIVANALLQNRKATY